VARWDGSSWEPLGAGLAGGTLSPGVRAMTVHDGKLYVAGHFGTGSLDQWDCGRNLRGLVMVDPTNGATDCSWIPQLEPYGSNYIGAWDVLRTGTHLWVIGKFTHISGVRQGAFARFVL
jgi:hypothetical protein